jgi:hypothetical protein
MGKTADNERLKLKGAFLNNIPAGLLLAGAAIPYLGISSHHDQQMDFIIAVSERKFPLTVDQANFLLGS